VDAGDWPQVSPWAILSAAAERDGDRKPRLLACAWCHHILDRLPPSHPSPGVSAAWLRDVIAAAERVADGPAVPPGLKAVELPDVRANDGSAKLPEVPAAAMVRWLTYSPGSFEPALFEDMPAVAERVLASDSAADWYSAFEHRQREFNDLILDVFGPVPAPPSIDPAWRTWNDGTVPKLALTVYDDRRFDLLPILADALEESGCDHAGILAHCRGSGRHVRGCWVVDLILEKM